MQDRAHLCYHSLYLDGLLRGRLFSNMDVSGTIDAILSQKGSEIFAISPDTTVYAAIELMAQKNIGALVMVENGTLLGLLSERDYTRKITCAGNVRAKLRSARSCRRISTP